jgi:ribose transport system substrate-binding protein
MSLTLRTSPRGTRVLFAIAATALLLTTAACGGGSNADTSSTSSSSLSTTVPAGYDGTDAGNFDVLSRPKEVAGTAFKVGYLNTNGGNPILVAMEDAAKKEVKALGGTFIGLDASSDPQKQASQLNQLIAQKVDIIIAHPTVAAALAPGIKAAKAAGIPVVAIGIPPDQSQPPAPNVETSISQGFDYSVYRTMKALADEKPGASFATIGLAIPVDQLNFMLDRMEFWGKKFGLKFEGKVDAPTSTPSGFAPAATAILTKYKKVDFVVTYNDEAAVAVSTTIANAGSKAKVATPNAAEGIARDAVKAGRLAVVYRVQWEKQGQQAAWAAYDVLTKQNLPLPTFINVPSYVVDAKNVDEASWLK